MDHQSVNSRPRHIYLDCTATANNGLNTGIQRVVRKLIQEGKFVSDSLNIPIVPVVYRDGAFQRIKLEENFKLAALTKKFNIEEKLRVGYFRAKVWLNEKFNRLELKWAFNFFFSIMEIIKIVLLFYFNRKRKAHFNQALAPIQFEKSDVLVLADSWWANGVSEGARAARENFGIKIITLIYDFIPMSHPELTAQHTTKEFTENLKIISKVSDSYIGISKFVRDEISKYIPGARYIDYFYLGSDFVPILNCPNSDIRRWAKPIAQGQFYLVVSTIEPRKGHDYILDAFEKHWSGGGQSVLCIVGRIGSGVDGLASRILHHPLKEKFLFNFFDVNDLELQELYSKSKALIFASKIEGFGLPLVEAMEKAKPILASDIPVFREICGDYATYFSLDDIEQLNSLLNNGFPTPKKGLQWLNWRQSAQMFFEKVIEAYRH